MIYANDFSRKFEFTLSEICCNSPFGTRIMSYFNSYHGIKYDFLDFWLQKNSSGITSCAICRYYSTLILCGQSCDKSELNNFVCMLSPQNIMSDFKYDFSAPFILSKGEVMVCRRLKSQREVSVVIHRSLSDMSYLRKIYDLLCRTDDRINPADFEDYFLDMSHKIRHCAAQVYSVYNDLDPVSTASVTALSNTDVVIGCVATDCDFRNKGLASDLVYYITKKQLSENRNVFLQRERKIELYEKIGFEVCGEWYEYKRI